MTTVAPSSPRVSVVIATFNRPAALRRCFDSLLTQGLAADCFEVVVVDVSTPSVKPVIDEYRDRLAIRHFHTENRGVAFNRNFGADKARAGLLVYLDDDCTAEPDWLETLLACAEAHPGYLVGGGVRNMFPDNAIACAGQVITEVVDNCLNRSTAEPVFFPGLNFAVPRARYLAIGGCDEAFGRMAAEDRDFADRWAQSGGRQVQAAGAIVSHAHRTDLAGFIRQYFNYGKGAWRYHSLRRSRGRGGVADSFGMHTRIWHYAREPLGGLSAGLRLKVIGLLLTWELANAAGFAWQAVKDAFPGRAGPGGP